MAEVNPAEVSAILKQQLSGFENKASLDEVGTVLTVGDGIARVYGLSNAQYGELVEFETGLEAIVLNLEEDNVGVVLLGPSVGISEIIKINGDGFNSQWINNFLIGTLSYNHLLRVKFDNNFNKVVYVEKIYVGSRIRDLIYIKKINSIVLSSELGILKILTPSHGIK